DVSPIHPLPQEAGVASVGVRPPSHLLTGEAAGAGRWAGFWRPDRGPILPHRPLRIAGALTLAAMVAGLIALVLWAILAAATSDGGAASRVDIPHLLRMTSIQAGLTTVLSLLVGAALAWALNRLRFAGRGLLVALFASAIVTPGMVVAFGLLS